MAYVRPDCGWKNYGEKGRAGNDQHASSTEDTTSS